MVNEAYCLQVMCTSKFIDVIFSGSCYFQAICQNITSLFYSCMKRHSYFLHKSFISQMSQSNLTFCRQFNVQSSGLPRSMPNADQCRSQSWHWSEMSLNADHCRNWSALIGIDRHWDQCQDFDRHWSALIGIGHWSRESCNHGWCNFFPPTSVVIGTNLKGF